MDCRKGKTCSVKNTLGKQIIWLGFDQEQEQCTLDSRFIRTADLVASLARSSCSCETIRGTKKRRERNVTDNGQPNVEIDSNLR